MTHPIRIYSQNYMFYKLELITVIVINYYIW